MQPEDIKKLILDVPDFPKKGIIFKDITPLLADCKAFGAAVEMLAAPFRGKGITHVAGIESRGFILAAPVALALGAAMVPVRKKGKLPRKVIRAEYALEYGTDILEMHADAMKKGDKALIIDDVLATGGTCEAVAKMIRGTGAELCGAEFLIELGFLNGKEKLKEVSVKALVKY